MQPHSQGKASAQVWSVGWGEGKASQCFLWSDHVFEAPGYRGRTEPVEGQQAFNQITHSRADGLFDHSGHMVSGMDMLFVSRFCSSPLLPARRSV